MSFICYITNQSSKILRQGFILQNRLHRNYHNFQSCITSCKQLNKIKQDPSWYENYRILDTTWDLDVRDYSVDHFSVRIPASKYFDLEECRDKNSPYKMMLPLPEQFEDYVSELGISNDHHVVIFDNHVKHAMFSAARLWWMFKVFGHDNVSVLNGGLKAWILEGNDTVSGNYTEEENLPKPTQKFKAAAVRQELIKDFLFVKANTEEEKPVPLLECRPRATEQIPGAVWTPFDHLLDNENNTIRQPDEIKEYFLSRNLDLDKEMVTTCGRAVSASVVSFCVYYATGKNIPVYDGSFSEWKGRCGTS